MTVPLAAYLTLGPPAPAVGPRSPAAMHRGRLTRLRLSPHTKAVVNTVTFVALALYGLCSVPGTAHVSQFLAVAPNPPAPAATARLRGAHDVFSGFPLPVSTNLVEVEPAQSGVLQWLGFGDDGEEEDEELDDATGLGPQHYRWFPRRAWLPFAPQMWLLLVAGGAAASLLLGARGRRASHLLAVFTPQGQTLWQESQLSMLAVTGTLQPATILGDGPLERQLAAATATADQPDVTLTADQWVAADGLPEGPILYCGPPDGVDAAIESTPAARRGDLVLLHNGTVDAVLERYGLAPTPDGPAAPTQCLAALALTEAGRLADTQPEGLTVACGRYAEDVAARLAAAGIACAVKNAASFRAVLIQNLIWQGAFALVGARFGMGTVGEVEARRPAEVSQLVLELLTACRAAYPSVPFDTDEVVVDFAHLVYAPACAARRADLA
eukprot:EG_transcript_12727